MTKLAEKIAHRIKTKFDLDVIPEIHRTYAGYHQKSAGAFSWFMLTTDNRCIGSCCKAKHIIEADDLDILWTDATQAEIFCCYNYENKEMEK